MPKEKWCKPREENMGPSNSRLGMACWEPLAWGVWTGSVDVVSAQALRSPAPSSHCTGESCSELDKEQSVTVAHGAGKRQKPRLRPPLLGGPGSQERDAGCRKEEPLSQFHSELGSPGPHALPVRPQQSLPSSGDKSPGNNSEYLETRSPRQMPLTGEGP